MEKIVEIPIEVMVEKPVFVEKRVERLVYVERNVKKPVTNITQEKEDSNLINRLDEQKKELTDLKIKISRLKAESNIINGKAKEHVFHAEIDYTSQNSFLRQKIRELEAAIVDARKGIIRKSLFGERTE